MVCAIILLGLGTLTLYYGYIKNLGNLAPIGKCCYNCSNMYLNSNYCIECGTDLRSELGFSYYYSFLGNYELRIKEDSFRITKYNYAKELEKIMKTDDNNIEIYKPGNNILTDDRAPVEVLGMRAIDEIISKELDYYREVINEEGIYDFIKS